MERKKIIIFGASGNVGSYLLKYALDFFDKEKYEVIASGKRKTNAFDKLGVEYYSIDLSVKESFSVLPTENIHAVILLSAKIPSYMVDYNARDYVESIIMGGFNVLEWCREIKVDRVLYTQTVYDLSEYNSGVVLKPNMPAKFSYTGDHAAYVISKNTILEFLKHYHCEYGIKTFIFRLPTIYNYSQYQYYFPNGIKTLRPVYDMINKAIHGETIELWGNPDYSKDMVYVDDFSQMICKAVLVDLEHGIYNVGTGVPVTLEEQIKTIIDVFSPEENKSKIIYRPEKKSGGGFLMDISNAKEELGYEPHYTCRMLFECYKNEMEINRFAELRDRDNINN
ncbi:NAD-dependent epimerase/dehydratase family protein [Pectobacterium aroidearum]|uniref:NAD-dependent epimerase/dehydratase family protein n=1 Tax=Pectobacterium aroidearum TaxID=1201031 RepID=UPI0033156F81